MATKKKVEEVTEVVEEVTEVVEAAKQMTNDEILRFNKKRKEQLAKKG